MSGKRQIDTSLVYGFRTICEMHLQAADALYDEVRDGAHQGAVERVLDLIETAYGLGKLLSARLYAANPEWGNKVFERQFWGEMQADSDRIAERRRRRVNRDRSAPPMSLPFAFAVETQEIAAPEVDALLSILEAQRQIADVIVEEFPGEKYGATVCKLLQMINTAASMGRRMCARLAESDPEYRNRLWGAQASTDGLLARRLRRLARSSIAVGALKFDYWNQVDPATFLADDLDNPARAMAAQIVAAECDRVGRPLRMLEVGPGRGTCYLRFYRDMVRAGKLEDYTMVEGSAGLADALEKDGALTSDAVESRLILWNDTLLGHLASEATRGCAVRHRVEPSYDIVYAKAVLEHQPTLVEPLAALLVNARRMVVVNFYRPPAGEQSGGQGADGCWYWTWKREDVLAVGRGYGWADPEIIACPPFNGHPGNELWAWGRR